MIIRSYHLGNTVLSVQEAFSWRLTSYLPSEIVQRTALDVHPPVYYFLLKAWTSLSGSSPPAMRSLSVILGILAVIMAFVLSLEICSFRPVSSCQEKIPCGWSGAVFCAFLVAVHESQVVPSRSARMYSLGVLLALLSAWLLLRALRAERVRELWWSGYGVAVAAFCYTHYFAFFTIAAQSLFAFVFLVSRLKKRTAVLKKGTGTGRMLQDTEIAPVSAGASPLFDKDTGPAGANPVFERFRVVLPSVGGLLYAFVIAALLYSPWLPVLWKQTQGVRQQYWIQPPTLHEVERTLFAWTAGMEFQGDLVARVWFTLAGLLLVWGLWRGGWGAWFLALQAALPWCLSLGLSAASGRPIFLERYLVFGQVFYLVFLGYAWRLMPGIPERLLLACWAGLPCLYGSTTAFLDRPDRPPAVLAAADFLKTHYQPGDLVSVANPQAVNILRYYASQAGMSSVDVRCPLNLFQQDTHSNHAASLTGEDILWQAEGVPAEKPRRLWLASDQKEQNQAPPNEMKLVLSQTFEGGGPTHYVLVLYARDP